MNGRQYDIIHGITIWWECCGLFVCSTPPYVELYIISQELYLKSQELCLKFQELYLKKNTSVTWFHVFPDIFTTSVQNMKKTLISLKAPIKRKCKEPIIDSACINMNLEYETHINLLGSVWASISVQKLLRVQNYTKIKTTKLKGHTKCWSAKNITCVFGIDSW